MDLTAINQLTGIYGKLKEINKKVNDIEFKSLLADFQNTIADMKLEIATLKEANANLKEELLEHKTKEKVENGKKPTLKWGCYQFEGEDGLFCPACYVNEGKKMPTNRKNIKIRTCPSCKIEINTG